MISNILQRCFSNLGYLNFKRIRKRVNRLAQPLLDQVNSPFTENTNGNIGSSISCCISKLNSIISFKAAFG